jgi:hypothetical protein
VSRPKKPTRKTRGVRSKPRRPSLVAAPVSARELEALRKEIERRVHTPTRTEVGKQRTAAAGKAGAPLRWNPEPEDVQKSVVQLVLTIVELLRRLMERQAIRRMEQKTLTRKEVELVGEALMKLEETVRDIGAKFDLTPEELNLDLGPLGKLM